MILSVFSSELLPSSHSQENSAAQDEKGLCNRLVSLAGKAELIDGVAEDRILSVHDPEMPARLAGGCHGHKSVRNRFDGYKASLAVETESQTIAHVDVLLANVHDSTNASSLTAESSKNLDHVVETVLGDGAYGTVKARLEAREQGYRLIAPVGQIAPPGRFTEEDFVIDAQTESVRCPAGQTTKRWYARPTRTKRDTVFQHRQFSFSVKQCGVCPLLHSCCLYY